MLTENQQPKPYILSSSTQKAYDKIKLLIMRIFAMLKQKAKQNLKEEFYDSYIDFARKLDGEGFHEESCSYMDICTMYHDLMDRSEELIAHEGFFRNLFTAFDELLYVRINKPEEYLPKSEEFLVYCGKMQEYYYTEMAIPSPKYNEETCKKIIGNLAGD
ncbi:hypothetical protein [Methanobrevibacter sp.]|uniref:hypothetical protein n=1 Tax=Methanobrevibacter sp. TaxID=66852 RepID=UPI0025F16D61|nr:hypothetical protein [Methanobrevibacter sp.]MBQ2666522.1 hypothetical protein [Methanobrevibacter sp.]